jgi:hypothetical protein
MTPELTAYTAALAVAAFTTGTLFGLYLSSLLRRDDKAIAYDDGYTDGSERRPRRWPV